MPERGPSHEPVIAPRPVHRSISAGGSSSEGGPDARLGITRDELQPDVRSYAENVQAQIDAVLTKYGAKDIEALDPLMIKGEVTIEERRTLVRLLKILEHIHTTGEVPE